MSKNKKIILIIVAIVLILAIAVGLVWWIGFGTSKENQPLDINESKLSKLYKELAQKQSYSFTTTLDDKNSTYYVKNNNMAYLDTIYQGNQSKTLVKDGNTYLLMEDQKTYYTYQNNETDLQKIEYQLNLTLEENCTQGKEKIEGKEYNYEEYEGTAVFLVKNLENIEEVLSNRSEKTRFYFNGNQLEYIKTIVGDYEEILKVNISDKVDNKLFEIPSDYQEG